ncbi:hypothetical protein RND71_029870 [Anisodus tanguticus]|uniref:G-patch domain-containing protein n=1 Tax=Anisodus tanguticus TaxID=243964 RepID=A0AAE1V0K6_9SOLA|nr:hypothetical protein RND71_029870 [Anisodus tanguticus]
MAGTEKEELDESENEFVWDESCQLYYHASTGFYHDPQAGWYYSCNDGLYYKFENATYVPIESSQDGGCEMNSWESIVPAESNKDETDADIRMSGENVAQTAEPLSTELSEEHLEDTNCKLPENPPPPSEWLEDTLIELYLANYSTQAANSTSDITVAPETTDTDQTYLSAAGNEITYELEEGEWIPDDWTDSAGPMADDWTDSADPNADVMDEGISVENVQQKMPESVWMGERALRFLRTGICLEEENWRAQYGQVERPFEDSLLHIRAVDLWDWSVVKKIRKGRKRRVARLVGRLVKPTAKLHPSMPSSGHLLKTAPVCEVHLDLVRVTSGQVYRLRNPSTKYLASLSNYDSSNPTKDWRFPQMSINREIQTCSTVTERDKPISTGLPGEEDVSLPLEISASERGEFFSKFSMTWSHGFKPWKQPLAEMQGKAAYNRPLWSGHPAHNGSLVHQAALFDRDRVYRDRAAERRALHGGFGVGPGQKKTPNSDDSVPLDVSAGPEEALSESLSNSFGAGSYARRILENMGWKEGEALGCSNKGLIEPLQAMGNKGSAGLGWKDERRKQSMYNSK